MPDPQPTLFANLALGLDAAFCNIAGLVFTLTGAFMADWLGVPGWVATVFGVALLVWSLVITLYANRKVARRGELDAAIKQNAAFIVLAAVVLAIPGSMTGNGKWLLVGFTGIVAAFMVAQLLARPSVSAETA